MSVSRPDARGSRLGLPVWAVLLLAALAMPRVVVHDLGIDVGSLGNALLAVGPPVVWVAVLVGTRVPSPVTTALAIGAVYGVGLGAAHNVMWKAAFPDDPELGGRLEGELPAAVEDLLLRSATMGSSILTGVVVGLVAGLVAYGLRRLAFRDGGRR